MSFNLDDYVDVAERIRLFYERWPNGRLTTVAHGVTNAENDLDTRPMGAGYKVFVWCKAAAYRNPDDQLPAIGTAWEPIPGPTPYTKDSELMNAETAAWGRAIIAAGIPSKKIASADEARARQPVPPPPPLKPASPTHEEGEPKVETKQHNTIGAIIGDLHTISPAETDWTVYSRTWITDQYGKKSRADLTKKEADALIKHLAAKLETEQQAMKEAEDIPF